MGAVRWNLSEVQGWLMEWFQKRGRYDNITGIDTLHADYFASGLLKSLEVIEFVCEIEERFGVAFSETNFQDRRFSTVAGLSQIISELAVASQTAK
jgi:D-alanine--poly(phosphoribitol) ligase subunit 2